jgi:hypothetical protein
LASDWYRERLETKQKRDVALWTRHLRALENYTGGAHADGLDVGARLAESRKQLARVSHPSYLSELAGSIGADPFHGQPMA